MSDFDPDSVGEKCPATDSELNSYSITLSSTQHTSTDRKKILDQTEAFLIIVKSQYLTNL